MPEIGVTAVDLSVVIVNHNHRPVIEKCIASLHALPDRTSFDVTLIDNTPADGAADWVAAHYPRTAIRRNVVRRGFAANANAGMRAAGSRYALLLNPDVTCLPGLLDRLIDFMDRHPETGIAAPQLFHEDGTRQPNCRRFPTPGTLAIRALRADEIWKTSHVRRYLMEDEPVCAGGVDWVTGAVLVARRAALETVGLLDERYFMYWEDMDWCYRMRRAGWGVFLVPEARAIHLHRREGVRRPFSRAGRAQLLGAMRFFRKFGWNPGKVA